MISIKYFLNSEIINRIPLQKSSREKRLRKQIIKILIFNFKFDEGRPEEF
jgi:hypothetical protein